jgi:hypothetical protein
MNRDGWLWYLRALEKFALLGAPAVVTLLFWKRRGVRCGTLYNASWANPIAYLLWLTAMTVVSILSHSRVSDWMVFSFLPASLAVFFPLLLSVGSLILCFLCARAKRVEAGVYRTAKPAYAHSVGLLSRCTELVPDWRGSSAAEMPTEYLTNLPSRKGRIEEAAQRVVAPVPLHAISKSEPIHSVSKTLHTFTGDGGVPSRQASHPSNMLNSQGCASLAHHKSAPR